jgi:broad specificity phosphatase PhoE
MTEPARLVLVRHARPADAGLRVFGSLDVQLGPDGIAQAERLIERLADETVTALYSSPLVRARDTARPLARELGLEPVIVPALREIDFGALEGLTPPELEERYPEYLPWTDDPAGIAFPGGESVAEVQRRALAATREIIAAHPGETAVVVSHGVTLRIVLADALHMPLSALFRLELSHCGISIVDWFGDRALVHTVNAGN